MPQVNLPYDQQLLKQTTCFWQFISGKVYANTRADKHDAAFSTGLPEDLELHHIIVNDWSKGVDAEQNVVLISIPSVKDPDMAPPGKHCLHAYLPATEPYHLWQGLDSRRCDGAADSSFTGTGRDLMVAMVG